LFFCVIIKDMTTETFENMPASTEKQAEMMQSLRMHFLHVLEDLIFKADVGSPLLELPILQVKCLRFVSKSEGCPMGEIARQMEIELPGLSRVVDRLEKRGYIKCVPDTVNRRIVRLFLTEQGRALMSVVEHTRQAHFFACLKNLNVTEMEQIMQSLKQLSVSVEQSLQAHKTGEPEDPMSDDPIVHLIARYPRTRSGRRKTPNKE
jgi:DNA-binding MarR family transcriptional regulator